MKFLHTADWQLGMKAAQAGKAAKRVRQARLESVATIVELCRENSVEFMVVTGDLFEDNGVERVLVQQATDLLAEVHVPVYIIPGNHDPLAPGSVWEHPAWKNLKNVFLLSEETPVNIPGGILYPCPVKSKYSASDPTAWIGTEEAGDNIRIALAHGSVEGLQQEENDYPIKRNVASLKKLDYLALGHWHSTALYTDEKEMVRMAYSGTHETSKFGERDSGNVLIVNIPAVGEAPEIDTVHCGQLNWRQIEEEVTGTVSLQRLRRDIETMERPEETLVKLNLKGLLTAEGNDEIVRIREILSSKFLYSLLDITQLRPAPEDENWISNLPAGNIREAGERLRELAKPYHGRSNPEGISPELATRALLELYEIASRE